MALITAIIPVFNRASTVGRAIRSVLAQELSAPDTIAITVVDDGSSDELISVLRDFGNTITLIHHARNLGAAAARNTGISSVRGGYIAFLDFGRCLDRGKASQAIDHDAGARMACKLHRVRTCKAQWS